ncbi:class I SAM-dependent methyltransferase [Coleofasciculus sp.]|uniref:class I SAM-dependent methyltransferase n=1 Tax=Coleofasciculus sp. TaxID=3100458 RepID=UPI0039FB0EB6
MSLSQKEQSLRQLIADKIAATPNQRISFAEYMNLVLYHPEQGYYATGAVNIGSEGDFFTSSHLGNDFGELLAEQFAQMWEILEQPKPFTLVEMGAGQGLVAADVLTYLHRQYPDCFAALDYIIIEKTAGLIKKQQQVLNQLNIPELPLRWCTFDDLPDHSIIGCCFSNELVDAFPVHQVVLEKGQLQEVYVTTITTETNEIHFGEVIDDLSTPQLKDYFQWMGIDLYSGAYPEGYRSEVNLAALDWMNTIADKLKRGFLLTIDYGYSTDRYYLPARHQGTLKCYYRHRHHDNPYVYIGQQDITAHVNFTALEWQGELSGLQTVGLTKQGLFLMALGLGDRISALSAGNQQGQAIAGAQDLIRIMRRRDALHQLIDPTGLGGFMVLVQSKGLSLEKARSLKGLTIPPIV